MKGIKFILLLISVFAAVGAQALTPLTGPVETMDRHLRVCARTFQPVTVSMTWNGNRRAEVTVPPAGSDDIIGGIQGNYYIFENDTLLTSGKYNCAYPAGDAAVSVILRVSRAGAEIEIGSESRCVSVPVEFDRANPVGTDVSVPPSVAVLRNDMRVSYLPVPEHSRFRSISSLNDYLARSRDPNEGLWRFLDRSTDRFKAQLGGHYHVATVRNDTGGYDIIYISGAREGDWEPFQIRGHLTPSGFENNYDLYWLDSFGSPAPAESYTTIDSREGIMTLVFPLLNSRIRFARILII